MRHKFFGVSAALVTFGIATISAAADDRETCRRGELAEETIAACSRLISRSPGVALYFNQRGNAYLDGKQAFDRAAADFDQAILLAPNDPNVAIAYFGRGNAYVGKRDYDRAI